MSPGHRPGEKNCLSGEPRAAWARRDHLLAGFPDPAAAFPDLGQLPGASRKSPLRTRKDSGCQGQERVTGRRDPAAAPVSPGASASTKRATAVLTLGLTPVYLLNRLGGTRRALQTGFPALLPNTQSALAVVPPCLCISLPLPDDSKRSLTIPFPTAFNQILIRILPLPCTERLKKKATKTNHGEVTGV